MKTEWSKAELMAEHEYAKPHVAAGMKLHGGFDEQGTYVSPRTKYRWDAVRSWQQQLQGKGYELLDASQDLLARGNYPNANQQLLLLRENLGRSFWDGLTITGIIEARGAMLAYYEPPNLQAVIEEDISHTATGHLSKGLLAAHGLDEGGDIKDENRLGAHDAMWFAVRDLIFGKGAYPEPEMPPSIERPKDGAFFPAMPDDVDGLFTLLMDVLMIEIRAESYFSFCIDVITARETFIDRPTEKKLAATMVQRIRTDEAIHVAYLQAVISELRSFTFKGKDGSRIKGAEMIDRVWTDMVAWHGSLQFDKIRTQRKASFAKEFETLGASRAAFTEEFSTAETALPAAAAAATAPATAAAE